MVVSSIDPFKFAFDASRALDSDTPVERRDAR